MRYLPAPQRPARYSLGFPSAVQCGSGTLAEPGAVHPFWACCSVRGTHSDKDEHHDDQKHGSRATRVDETSVPEGNCSQRLEERDRSGLVEFVCRSPGVPSSS